MRAAGILPVGKALQSVGERGYRDHGSGYAIAEFPKALVIRGMVAFAGNLAGCGWVTGRGCFCGWGAGLGAAGCGMRREDGGGLPVTPGFLWD
jgi:hypothetical protein